MCMFKFSYLMAIVPVAVLLTISFFVLVTLRKIEEKALKVFGYVVVSFLWLAALVVFSGAVYRMAQGSPMSKGMMQQKMKMDCMSKNMPKHNPAVMTMPENDPLAKDQKHPEMPKCAGNKGNVFKAD
jgi:high-affinity K+ transport system ATPase subunit B